jgi:NAD(P)-dependent dehydrogenase (short-subunit alcohol dehydrogenase family)
MLMSEPKTALVTGANKGIGHEIVRQLLAKGLRIFLTARDAEAGHKAVSGLQGDIQFLQMDVSDDASIENAASTYGTLGIALDVLVNNAAIYPDKDLDILTISREQLVKTFQTNTFAPLAVTQAFLPFLKKSSAARIINISSGYGEVGGSVSHCAQLLFVEADVEWHHHYARSGASFARHRSLRDVSGMGSHRYGRSKRFTFGGRRRGYRRLAGHRCTAKFEREVLSGSRGHRMVERGTISS